MRYKIKSGRHYNSNWIMRVLTFFRFGRVMSGTFLLEHDNYYSKDEQIYSGQDKLCGFGGFNPHKNSARLSKQPNHEMGEGWINIFAYCYLDGERVTRFITTVHTGWRVDMYIEAIKGYGYRFIVNGSKTVDIEWDGKQPRFIRYGYYHGGESPAPKEENAIINTKIFHRLWQ